MDKTKFRPIGVENDKADNSVIALVESGTTASRAYAIGEHFIKNGAFCTAKKAIARNETFTLNTNYTAEDIGLVFGKKTNFTPTGAYMDAFHANRCTYTRMGNATLVQFQIWLKSTATSGLHSDVINASDIGLIDFTSYQFAMAYSQSNSIVKVIANWDTNKIQFETLIGNFPSGQIIYGQIMVTGTHL